MQKKSVIEKSQILCMKKLLFRKNRHLVLLFLTACLAMSFVSAQTQEARIVIVHLRGLTESKISLIPLSGARAFKPLRDASIQKDMETTFIVVPKDYVPGEFTIQFESKSGYSDKVSTSNRNVFINNQDLEVWINPRYAEIPDSTRFQEGESENTAFTRFTVQNEKTKMQLFILRDFLVNYDAKTSAFYRKGLKEYKQQRLAYNQWLHEIEKSDKDLFVSSIYKLHYIPNMLFDGTETEKTTDVIQHYFDGISFQDTLLIRTTEMTKWMDAYVNLHGRLITSMGLRDSVLTAAAQGAIEKARAGHPLVYGWMVDYFYRGFESNQILSGVKVLEQYTKDPNCLTSKRLQIDKRLRGMQTLIEGTIAPNIVLNDADGNLFDLNNFQTGGEGRMMLFFYTAGCSHCNDLINELKPWYDGQTPLQRPEIVAVSLDDNEADIKSWNQLIQQLPGWTHLRADGINSRVANDYYLLSTPVMILLDSRTKEILALPASFSELTNMDK